PKSTLDQLRTIDRDASCRADAHLAVLVGVATEEQAWLAAFEVAVEGGEAVVDAVVDLERGAWSMGQEHVDRRKRGQRIVNLVRVVEEVAPGLVAQRALEAAEAQATDGDHVQMQVVAVFSGCKRGTGRVVV